MSPNHSQSNHKTAGGSRLSLLAGLLLGVFGGGVVIAWIQTYSDLLETEYVLINNEENDAYNPDNIDPWSSQGPQVGGEVYGGFHLNLDKVFRLTFDLGYLNVAVPDENLKKATNEEPNRQFDAKHLPYRLAQFKFGGGFEFRF